MLLRTIADFVGWLAYLTVVGGGLADRELVFPYAVEPSEPTPGDGHADERGDVLRLDDYRQRRRSARRRRAAERKPPRAA